MPYKYEKHSNKWVKINKNTGKVVSHHKTKKLAKASAKAYYAKKKK